MKTPNKIIIIWRTVEGYEPQPFHIFQTYEISEARAFTAYAIEKDNENEEKAHYSLTIYEKIFLEKNS